MDVYISVRPDTFYHKSWSSVKRVLIDSWFDATVACRTDKSITIQNPAPKAVIFSHSDGDVVLEGFVTTFVGNVTDANHTADQLNNIFGRRGGL